MPPAFGIDYLAPVRSFRNFFGRYGTTSGSIRGVLNAVIPVAVVDRFRDDTEGSLFGLTMATTVPAGRLCAFAMGSAADDWELLAANVGEIGIRLPTEFSTDFMVYTPDSTYIPVGLPSPVGFWEPGLNTDWSFTLSSVSGISGSNAALPARFGFMPFRSVDEPQPAPGNRYQEHAARFDPPIRVYRDVTLGILADRALGGVNSFTCTILYRTLPRTTDGPRTG